MQASAEQVRHHPSQRHHYSVLPQLANDEQRQLASRIASGDLITAITMTGPTQARTLRVSERPQCEMAMCRERFENVHHGN